MSKNYNGHKNWNHWNVALWINNDQGLYNIARAAIKTSGNRDQAAQAMAWDLIKEYGMTHTPDGAPYSITTIRAAMVGM